jgi:hypothetical protein
VLLLTIVGIGGEENHGYGIPKTGKGHLILGRSDGSRPGLLTFRLLSRLTKLDTIDEPEKVERAFWLLERGLSEIYCTV